MDYVIGKCGMEICSNCAYFYKTQDNMSEEEYKYIDKLSNEFFGFGLTRCGGCECSDNKESRHLTSKCKQRKCLEKQEFKYCTSCEKYPCKNFAYSKLMYGPPDYKGIDEVYIKHFLEQEFIPKEDAQMIKHLVNCEKKVSSEKMKMDIENFYLKYYQKYKTSLVEFPESMQKDKASLSNNRLYNGLNQLHNTIKKMYESLLQITPEVYTDLDDFEANFKALTQALWNFGKYGKLVDGNSIGIPNIILVVDRKIALDLKIPSSKKKEKELLQFLKKNNFNIETLDKKCITEYKDYFDWYDTLLIWNSTDCLEDQSIIYALVHYVKLLIKLYGDKKAFERFESLDMSDYNREISCINEISSSISKEMLSFENNIEIDRRYVTPKYHKKVKKFRDVVFLYVDKEIISKETAEDLMVWSTNIQPNVSASKRALWIKDTVCKTNKLLEPNIRRELMQSCSYCMDSNSIKGQIRNAKKIHANSQDLLNSIQNIIEKCPDLFYKNVEQKGNTFEFINKKECSCTFVNDIWGNIQLEYCTCAAGKYKYMFKEIFGLNVDVEVISSIKSGSGTCIVRVTLL